MDVQAHSADDVKSLERGVRAERDAAYANAIGACCWRCAALKRVPSAIGWAAAAALCSTGCIVPGPRTRRPEGRPRRANHAFAARGRRPLRARLDAEPGAGWRLHAPRRGRVGSCRPSLASPTRCRGLRPLAPLGLFLSAAAARHRKNDRRDAGVAERRPLLPRASGTSTPQTVEVCSRMKPLRAERLADRVWARRGSRPTRLKQTEYDWVYAYGRG